MKFYFILFLVLTIFTAAAQTKFINVTGNSEIIKKADQARFTVHIKTINESLEASKTENDKNLSALLVILRNMNIPSDVTEISPLAFGKNYESTGEGTQQKGYFTSVNVSFLLKDLKRYYEITNRLSANDAFEINADYNISDYEIQNRRAFEKALEAAREKGKYMSETLGLKLGEVLEIEENMDQPYPMLLNTVTREIESGNITGNVSIRRSVRVKFAIASGDNN